MPERVSPFALSSLKTSFLYLIASSIFSSLKTSVEAFRIFIDSPADNPGSAKSPETLTPSVFATQPSGNSDVFLPSQQKGQRCSGNAGKRKL